MRELTPLEYLKVQARKNKQQKKIHQPLLEWVKPDGWCIAYQPPKAAFFTEDKAAEALEVAQHNRPIQGYPMGKIEVRVYRCTFGKVGKLPGIHWHLTSQPFEAREAAHE